MGKGRWLIGGLLLVGAFTVGAKQMEPLWDTMRHDPAIGIIIVVFFLLLILFVVRLIRQ